MKADTRRVLAFILAGLILAIGVGVAVWRAGAPGAAPTAGTSPDMSQTANEVSGSSTAPRGARANVKPAPSSPAAADRSGRDVALATDDPFLAPHAVVNTSRRQADPTRWFRPGNISDVQVQADGLPTTSLIAQPPAAGTNIPATPVVSPGAPPTNAVPPAPGGANNPPAPAPGPDSSNSPGDNAPVPPPPAPSPADTPPVTPETTDKEPTDIVPPTTDTPVATATPTEAPTTPAEPTPTTSTTGTPSAPLTTTIDSTPVEPVATATPTPVATQTPAATATATPTPGASGGPTLTP